MISGFFQRLLEIKGGSTTSVTAFYGGLGEMKNGFSELKKRIGIIEDKIKDTAVQDQA